MYRPDLGRLVILLVRLMSSGCVGSGGVQED